MPESVWWLLIVLVVSAVGTVLYLRRERRRPSYRSRWEPDRFPSYRSQFEAEMAEWRVLPTAVQARRDEVQLKAGEPATAHPSGLSRS